jgi:tetratricopeptide (TPR) repeat protein
VLSGGDDDDPSPPAADRTPAEPAKPDKNAKPDKKQEKEEPKAEEEPPAAAPAPEEEPAETGSYDEARGTELNDEGFRLMNAGDYDGAVAVLQQAVDSFPPNTGNITYAYALYNLGRSLRLAGRPGDAIPILERRLEIPDQTEKVQAELDLAKQEAGQG